MAIWDFAWVSDPSAWAGLGTLILIEIVLGIDNIVFISILSTTLPPSQRRHAFVLGLGLALVARLALLSGIAWVVTLTQPIMTLMGHDFSWRDIILIIGGIFFELKAPGIGLPTAVALIAAVLYFLPLYLNGTAENWEILLFVAGVILLILELFVIPGFGIAGITGGVLILASFILALVSNVVFDFTFVSGETISRSILTVMAGFVIAVLLLLLLSRRIGQKGLLYNFALHAEQAGNEGYIGVDETPRRLVGKRGVTVTRMAPSGKIKVDGEIYDAISLYGSFIEAGSEITIEKYENSQLYVVFRKENTPNIES